MGSTVCFDDAWTAAFRALGKSPTGWTTFLPANFLVGILYGLVVRASPAQVWQRPESCFACGAGSMGGLLGDSADGHRADGSVPQQPFGHGHRAGPGGCESGGAAGGLALPGAVLEL